jgi:hypothetical protein
MWNQFRERFSMTYFPNVTISGDAIPFSVQDRIHQQLYAGKIQEIPF